MLPRDTSNLAPHLYSMPTIGSGSDILKHGSIITAGELN